MMQEFRLKGVHVLAALLAFFGVIFAVNAVFITQAVRTFPGEQAEKSYLQGLEYNRVLTERAEQAALGWTASIERAAFEGHHLVVEVRVTDAEGAPLSGLALEGALRRPAAARLDRPLAFAPLGNGRYRAVVEDAPPGLWIAEWRAVDGRGRALDAEARLTLE